MSAQGSLGLFLYSATSQSFPLTGRLWKHFATKYLSISSLHQSEREHYADDQTRYLAGAVGIIATSALGGTANANTGDDELKAIPELAPQWKKLDLAKILQKPAAFASVSHNNSLYEPWGAQAAEKHWERGSLAATIKVVNAARKSPNFKSFSWIGYEVFRETWKAERKARWQIRWRSRPLLHPWCRRRRRHSDRGSLHIRLAQTS
jgi:hypothetical protein